MSIPRFTALESSIPAGMLINRSASLPDELRKQVEGSEPGPWPQIGEELRKLDARDDISIARLVREQLVVDRRSAADLAIWRYATVFHLRDYVFDRWDDKGAVRMERLMGGVRRNAVARLWWLVETLEGDGAGEPELTDWVLAANERLKLQYNDFNSFHGRPWLARWVAFFLKERGRPSDAVVDQTFKALGRLSNVLVFDYFVTSPDSLRAPLEEEVASGP